MPIQLNTKSGFVSTRGRIGLVKTAIAKDLSGTFDINTYMDLINLHSDVPSSFNLTGSSINSWAEVGGTLWSQGTAANKPNLTLGVPTFDALNDTIIRASEVSGTVFSLYIIFKNTSALTKILLGAGINNDYFLHGLSPSDYQMRMYVGAVSKCGMEAGIALNKRYVVFSVRRNGNTIVGGLNNRKLYNRTNTFAGELTRIQKLMTNPAGNFPMGGGIKAVCMSSQNLSDTIHNQVVDSLYTRYNLSADTAPMTNLGFGDSNTFGTGSTSYLVGLGTLIGLAHSNLGISGTLFTNYSASANNGFDRFDDQLLSKPFTDNIIFNYCTNDVLNAVSATNWATQANQKISGAIAKGHPANKFVLIGPPYQKFGANAALLDQYNAQMVTMRDNLGVKYWDLLTWMRNNGGDALMVDNVHYNQTTQDAIMNNVYTLLTT